MGEKSAHNAAERAEREKASRARAIQQILTPAIWGIGIALGCTLAWPLMAFQSQGLFIGIENQEQALDYSYLLSIIATVVTLALCGIFHKQCDRFLGGTVARVLFPTGIAISTLLVLGAGLPAPTGQIMLTAFGVLSGVFTALFLMNFGAVIGLLTLKQSAACIAIGYLLSTILFFIFLFFGRLEATVFCASMGPVAAVFLFYGINNLKMNKNQANSLPRQNLPSDPTELHDLRALLLAFSLTMFITGVAYEMSRTLYIQMGDFANGSVVPYAIAQGGVTTLTVIGSIGIALAIIGSRNVAGPEICYKLAMFFTMLGVLLVPMPLLFPQMKTYIPLAINIAAFQCLGMGMWVLISGLCRRYQTACLHIFGVIRANWAAGPLVGMLIGRALWRGGLTVESAFVSATICICLIVIVNNFIFTETMLAKALSIMPTGRKQRFQDRCRAVIERYGLTEREGEIMIMFAKGRNLPYVQEELCLSKSTVSTHRQHIYQKLGVHSAQEMIDLIQEEKV